MISLPCKMIVSLTAGGAAVALAVLTLAAQAVPTVTSCQPTNLKIIASTLVSGLSPSNSFSNIPETFVAFTQGGTKVSCVIVRFSAEISSIGAANNVRIRPFLDNTTAAFPLHVRYAGDDGTVSTAHSFEFVFPGVAPGSHVIRMQAMSSASGAGSSMSNRSTVVQFAP